ncbi:MAG TPA: tetratricopeptide repeat protein [Methanocorpusculum sp.]|nr:tetratricopeptide repeat protein [Methanocorpusculum sp.]
MSEDILRDAAGHVSAFEYDMAEKQYDEYLKEHGDDDRVWMMLGTLRLRMEDLPGSSDAFGNAFDIHPENVEYAIKYGDSLMLVHKYDEAEAVFSYAAKSDSGYYVRMREAEACVSLQKTDDGLARLLALSTAFPEEPEIWHCLYRIYLSLGRSDEAQQAREQERKFLRERAESSRGAAEWLAYGRIEWEFREYARAEQACAASVAVEDNAPAHLYRGLSLLQLGNADAGHAELDAGLAIEPRDLSFVLQTAELLEEIGRYEDSIVWYTKALALRNIRADTWAACAYALLQAGKKDEARAFFEMAKASSAVREFKWADKLHKSFRTAALDAAFGGK